MTLTQQLSDYIAAAFAGLWVATPEPDEAHREIAALCGERSWAFSSWDCAAGASGVLPPGGPGDPLYPLRTPAPGTADPADTHVVVLHNFHRFLTLPVVVQALFNAVRDGKQNRTILVVLAPGPELPPELQHVFAVLEHPLPGRADLAAIAREMGDPALTDDRLGVVLDAAAGLTRYEAEGAYALSLARHGEIRPDAVWELKTQALRKSGLLTLHRGGDRFSALGGLDALKQFCLSALRHSNGVKARGVMLLGVPGTGKSAFAKALGAEAGRPTLVLDPGSLMGSLVGQTEANVRRALATVDALSPCILFVDEIEKALAGSTSAHAGDSGVSARMLGSLLTWLNDHESNVFVVCTSNDVSRLPPEFCRAERFDAVFFLDLPDRDQRAAIWRLYQKVYDLPDAALLDAPPGRLAPNEDVWTGAEIRACCRLAKLLGVGVGEAARQVVPVAVTAADRVQQLREWASHRCLDATRGGLFRHDAANPPTNGVARRSVTRRTPS